MTHDWDDSEEATRVYDPRPSLQPQDERWFISRDRVAKQQLSAAQILDLCQDGTLSEATLVWRDGLSGWTPLGEVPELAQALRAFSKVPPLPVPHVELGGPLPSLPVGSRAGLPSLPPPPTMPPLQSTNTTTPPERRSLPVTSSPRTPNVVIDERAASGLLGRAGRLSLFTLDEPYSLRLGASRRVGLWSVGAALSALLLGLGLGLMLFSEDSESQEGPVRVIDLDQRVDEDTKLPGGSGAGED
jgi:hypothetical protein